MSLSPVVAIILVTAWAVASGTVAAWFGHRYQVAVDDEGNEELDFSVLGDATCPRCDHVISLAEAAPGRSSTCASCATRLPLTWVGAQLSVLAGCLAMLSTFGPHMVLLPFLWLVPVVVAAAVTDLRTMLIPKRLVWVGFGVGLASIAGVALSTGHPAMIRDALIGAGAYFAFLFVMHVILPSGMGFGDVRLALVLGLYLGWIDLRLPLFGLLIANLVYLVYAVPQRISKGKEAGRFAPFGPGLALGTLLAVYFYASLVPTA